MSGSITYWHGGAPGRKRGDLLLSSAVTGAKSTADFGAAGVCRRDRVYVTTDPAAAILYASAYPRGVYYEVSPVGEIEPDPDCDQPGLSYSCLAATVLRILHVSARQRTDCLKVLLGLEAV